MAQGRSTQVISMIKWIRTSRLSTKNSVFSRAPPSTAPSARESVASLLDTRSRLRHTITSICDGFEDPMRLSCQCQTHDHAGRVRIRHTIKPVLRRCRRPRGSRAPPSTAPSGRGAVVSVLDTRSRPCWCGDPCVACDLRRTTSSFSARQLCPYWTVASVLDTRSRPCWCGDPCVGCDLRLS